jgi:hypothetical protein
MGLMHHAATINVKSEIMYDSSEKNMALVYTRTVCAKINTINLKNLVVMPPFLMNPISRELVKINPPDMIAMIISVCTN